VQFSKCDNGVHIFNVNLKFCKLITITMHFKGVPVKPDIVISSQDTVHYAGDVITCSAAGYPPADYVWSDVNNSSIRVNGSVFFITTSMIGMTFTLQCIAKCTVNGMTYNFSSTPTHFTVAYGKFGGCESCLFIIMTLLNKTCSSLTL